MAPYSDDYLPPGAGGGSSLGGLISGGPSSDTGSKREEGKDYSEKSYILQNPSLLLELCVAEGISDIHLRVGHPPIVRKNGKLIYTRLPLLTPQLMDGFINCLVPEEIKENINNVQDFDFAFELPELARFRCNLLREMNNLAFAIRIIKNRIPKITELGLPAGVEQFVHGNKGLVLVTGPTGSGKSTTLASIIDTINRTYPLHIITIEDPIEYMFKPDQGLITQRQLGIDTDSYPHALKYMLRQDPDVILIGEMRDRETVSAALHAAETGHLVFSTLHTVDAVQTIHRIINLYEPHERDAVRSQLGSILVGTISQRLATRLDDSGRVAVGEVLIVSPTVQDLIYKNEIETIYDILQNSEFDGSCSLNYSLYLAERNKYITQEEALRLSVNRGELMMMFRGSNQKRIDYQP